MNPVVVELHQTVFHIKTSYQEARIRKIKELRSAWWNSKQKVWIAKACIENLQKLQNAFSVWEDNDFAKIHEIVALLDDPMVVELYRTPDNIQNIWVKLRGYKIDVDFMKHIPDRDYDKAFRRWSIPNEQVIIDRIIAHFEDKGARVINRLPELNEKVYNKTNYTPGQKQKHFINKFDPKYQNLVEEVSAVMIAQRYSWKTIQSYIGNLVPLVDFLHGRDIHKATAQEVNIYVQHISSMDVSESKINLVINSIKFFYSKVVFRPDFEIDKIKRPRKSKKLPYILSKGEIERILQSLDNIKHVALLYTLYSSGMRLSEILNLRVDDVFFDRNQLFIRGGKGKKDRVVMLSEVLKRMLILYTDEYKPIYWLFEGQDRKKQYSAGSVQKVVKNAGRKAGLTKKVTPHQIRHCFATHLLDGGTDIRFIQELLGHSPRWIKIKNLCSTMFTF